MSKVYLKYFLTLCVLSLLSGWVIAHAQAAPLPQNAPPLFQDAGFQVSAANVNPAVVRSRTVTTDFSLLATEVTSADAQPNPTLTLNLFDNATFTAVRDRLEALEGGGYAWSGHLEGIELSQVTLVVLDGVVSGSITLPGANYQIRPDANGFQIIQEINDAALPPDLHKPMPTADTATADTLAPAAVQADDGSVIDVLILYTDAARSAAGSATAIQTLINQSIVQTNNAFSNSQVNTRLRLVYSGELAYTEAGFDTDLQRLASTSDSFLNEAHTLRDQYGADLVSLLVAERSACGIAYVGNNAQYGFSVVNYDCAPNLVLAHELGHNLGAFHDWFVDGTTGWAPGGLSDNHGWVDYTGNWRSIMSYGDYCYQQSPAKNCSRIAYYSNPNLTYSGRPIGLAAGSDSSCKTGDLSRQPTCDANNARVFNANLKTIANYRQSKTPVTPATPTTTPVAQPTSTPTKTAVPATPTATPVVATPTPTPNPTTIKVNFQPQGAALPTGYLLDSGATYGNRGNGYSYGWNANNSANTRDRNASNAADQRYDTLIYMQRGALYTWEIALPNGAYQVRLVAGDATYSSSVYKVNAEGVLLVNGTPTTAKRWIEGTATVTVNDGRLTLTNASGAVNNKLNFIEISKAPSGAAGNIQPTAITAQMPFAVTISPTGMQLNWTLGQAKSSADFHLFRNTSGDRTNATEITADLGELTPSNGNFTAIDPTADPTATYHYWLTRTNRDGTLSEVGPVMQGAEDRVFAVFLPALTK